MNESRTSSSARASQALIGDDMIRGLSVMLDADLSNEQISLALENQNLKLVTSRIRYVRYKPATNCIIGYSVGYTQSGSTEEQESYVYAKCYLKEDFANAAEKFERISGVGSISPASLFDIDTIVYPVQCDKELDGTELAFSPRKIARNLREGLTEFPDSQWRLSDKKLTAEIVRYKPERRTVIKLQTRVKNRTTGEKQPVTVYARCYADDRGKIIGPLMTTLAEKGALLAQPVLVPAPISYLPAKRTLLIRSVDGRPLSECLASPGADRLMAKTGLALRWLHSVEYENLGQANSQDLLGELNAATDSLKRLVPSQAKTIEEIRVVLIERLSRVTEFPVGLAHGDFYSDQVLVTSVYNPVALIDFDRAFRGNQWIDLANFCAGLRLQSVWQRQFDSERLEYAFLQSYFDNDQDRPTADQFETLVAAQMLKQVIAPFRRWDLDWNEKIETGLAECRGVIG